MLVKIFDFEHEVDLQEAINKFIKNKEIVNITYQTSHFYDGKSQIFSFSAMVVYKTTVQK